MKLFKHQKQSIKKLQDMPFGYDASDAGTGKTRVQIELMQKPGRLPALVLCPKSIMEAAWADDIKKFAPNLRVSVARAANRHEAFETPADVYITNIDAATWLAEQKPKFFSKFSTLIIDESSAYKHHTSKRSKAVVKIRKHFNYAYLMSGTPASNTITDIWHQIKILDGGTRLGTSFFAFRSAVCAPEQVGPRPEMVKWKDKPGAEQTVAAILSDITVRHKLEECLDLPENTERKVTYRPNNKVMKIYREMENNAIAAFRDGKIVSAVNASSVYTKLAQILSGAVYDENGGYVVVDTERYELVADMAEEREAVVIFFLWTHQRDELIKQMKKRDLAYAVIDGTVTDKNRKDAVDGFQSGFYRVILAHPAAAAHGLTLTKGVATIWPTPTSNLEWSRQGNRRIYRAGVKHRTESIMIAADDTVESLMVERLMGKRGIEDSMLSMMSQLQEMRG